MGREVDKGRGKKQERERKEKGKKIQDFLHVSNFRGKEWLAREGVRGQEQDGGRKGNRYRNPLICPYM